MQQIFEQISKTPIFKSLKITEIEELISSEKMIIKSYEKDEIIRFRGEKVNEVMILLSGQVKAEMSDTQGKIIEIEEIKAPNLLAVGATFSKNSIIPVDIIAIEKSTVAFINKDEVLNLCMHNKDFLQELIEYLGTKFVFISQRLWFITLNNIKDKILFHIKGKLKDSSDDYVILEYSVEQLSHLFGVTRPSLSRAFSKLEEEGIIKKEGNKIYILNKNIFKDF
ncbi:cyclic nucleotide-binding protein [Marinitoga piezophila KA3]|uniref:Cyclic nucleotide-binding protein n=1 Tax=Marinitoga piezophila (strain DSM 14283 / JCM 11233 / KA3) TaxID=443254 RepID=H2J4T2_MARPK|nr:Crp/Fnr family transcriptional regulator [Marinitoga piezophila]AEX84867.1 cyclic nucleotide-binding protein [Marinitoga piezophila KA3]